MAAQGPLQAWRAFRYLECGITDRSICACLWELQAALRCSRKNRRPKGPKRAQKLVLVVGGDISVYVARQGMCTLIYPLISVFI